VKDVGAVTAKKKFKKTFLTITLVVYEFTGSRIYGLSYFCFFNFTNVCSVLVNCYVGL